MSLRVDLSILNQKGTPAFYSDTFANRPAAGFAGRVFISTDTGAIYEDTGSTWTLIADAGAGTTGTLEQVTTNGNTTTKGLVVTSGNVAIGTAIAGAPLDIHATGTAAQFNGTGTNNAHTVFQNAGTSKWRIGNTYSAGANNLDIYNNTLAANALSFTGSTSAATFANSITATSIIKSGGTSTQFLKGDGSVDTNSYLPLTGGTMTGLLTLNNTTPSSYGLQINNSSGNPCFVAYQESDSSYSLKIAKPGFTTINLYANDSSSYINTAGNFGLGNNNPTYKLDVTGSGRFTTTLLVQGITTLNNILYLNYSNPIVRFTGATLDGYIINSSDNMYIADFQTATKGIKINLSTGATTILTLGTGTVSATSGTLSTISDMNLKIEDGFIENALQKVLNLKPRYFLWKKESGLPNDIRQLGFYAQEVNEALGEEAANTPKNDNEKWGIYDRSIIAMLTKAIQELNEKLVKNNIN